MIWAQNNYEAGFVKMKGVELEIWVTKSLVVVTGQEQIIAQIVMPHMLNMY